MADEKQNPSRCPHARRCGGCQLQNMTYDRQLQWKQSQVIHLLKRFGHVSPILGMEHPYHYRNKVQAAFGKDRRGAVISGVYQASSHTIVPVDSCQIEDETADRIIVTIRGLLKTCRIPPYEERTGRGFLRHVLVKRGFHTGQVMVVLVAATPVFPTKNRFLRELLAAHPEITTILFHVNARDTSLVLGDREQVLYGPGFIEDELCGCVFRISARSFYQINPVQTQALYTRAMQLAGLTGRETVLDAYCGVGTIGLIATQNGAKQVIGVENNPDAVRDAIANAKRNGIHNAWFTCADASAYMTELAREGQVVDVVFLDPPRAGSTQTFLSALTTLAPKRVVYISCNPETLARDLSWLIAHSDYRVQTIQPVDMFPHTNHVESVVLLSHKSPDRTINMLGDIGVCG